MKRVLISALILCVFCSAYAQQDLIKEIGKQAVVIDSLQKAIKAERDNTNNQSNTHQKTLKSQSDTIKILRVELFKLEKFKADKENIDALLKQKSDSITLLSNQISETKKQILVEKQKCEEKSREEKDKGKNETLADIVNTYKNKNFDDLIILSTKFSVQRDCQFVGYIPEIKLLLIDLNRYFDAKAVLDKQFNIAQIKDIQLQLNQVRQQSALLDKLKETLENYQAFNKGLMECLGKVIVLDKKETVTGMGEDIMKQKYNKILSEISSYIFNYDFNFIDYPYLSDIVLQVIKLKQPNPDADISNLLKKLQ